MLGDGDRMGSGPDGLQPEDKMKQSKNRIKKFEASDSKSPKAQQKSSRLRVNA